MTLETEETTKRERNSNGHEAVLDSSAKTWRGSSAFAIGSAIGDDFGSVKTGLAASCGSCIGGGRRPQRRWLRVIMGFGG